MVYRSVPFVHMLIGLGYTGAMQEHCSERTILIGKEKSSLKTEGILVHIISQTRLRKGCVTDVDMWARPRFITMIETPPTHNLIT